MLPLPWCYYLHEYECSNHNIKQWFLQHWSCDFVVLFSYLQNLIKFFSWRFKISFCLLLTTKPTWCNNTLYRNRFNELLSWITLANVGIILSTLHNIINFVSAVTFTYFVFNDSYHLNYSCNILLIALFNTLKNIPDI